MSSLAPTPLNRPKAKRRNSPNALPTKRVFWGQVNNPSERKQSELQGWGSERLQEGFISILCSLRMCFYGF